MPDTLSRKNRCVVVIPVYKKEVTEEESISIHHLQHFLEHYDIAVAAPEGLRIPSLPYRYVEFHPARFASLAAYSNLLLSKEFYSAFEEYEFILIYQLDSLVFNSNLDRWLDAPYDYLGAPLFVDKHDPSKGLSRIGNGGLSLRRVSAFMNVIDSNRYLSDAPSRYSDIASLELPDLAGRSMLSKWLKTRSVLKQIRVGSEKYRMSYTLNEDHFWSDRARLFDPAFRIAPVEVGLEFAFEMYPQYCFEKTGNTMPFGCHAWAKWDRSFWEPYLIA